MFKLRKRKEVKHNYQAITLIIRKLIILFTILPLLWVSKMRGTFTGFTHSMVLWVTVAIEIASLIFLIHLCWCRERAVKSEIAKAGA